MSAAPRLFPGADGHALAASVEGAGRPVLMLHGGGQTRHAWRKTGHDLAKAGFMAVRLDQRGHGDSPWDEAGRYHFFDYGRDAAAVARALRAETGLAPIAIGASLGGIAALLGLNFIRHAVAVLREPQDAEGRSLEADKAAKKCFRFSLTYLFALFAVLAAEKLILSP